MIRICSLFLNKRIDKEKAEDARQMVCMLESPKTEIALFFPQCSGSKLSEDDLNIHVLGKSAST
jgi:hypothetical protein